MAMQEQISPGRARELSAHIAELIGEERKAFAKPELTTQALNEIKRLIASHLPLMHPIERRQPAVVFARIGWKESPGSSQNGKIESSGLNGKKHNSTLYYQTMARGRRKSLQR